MIFSLGEDPNKRTSAKIGKEMIKDMVLAYQDPNRSGKLNFNSAHYTVNEIIDLFVGNGIILPPTYVDTKITHGLKIYMGNHHKLANCPLETGSTTRRRIDYKNYNTPILCNTIMLSGKFADMLDKERDDKIVLIQPREGGDGLDQTMLCPPDCYLTDCSTEEVIDESCIYDITKQPLIV